MKRRSWSRSWSCHSRQGRERPRRTILWRRRCDCCVNCCLRYLCLIESCHIHASRHGWGRQAKMQRQLVGLKPVTHLHTRVRHMRVSCRAFRITRHARLGVTRRARMGLKRVQELFQELQSDLELVTVTRNGVHLTVALLAYAYVVCVRARALRSAPEAACGHCQRSRSACRP